jgi:DNA-directed RNA polymerase subunit RPC12/RpoP
MEFIMPLTPEQKAAYLKHDVVCPYCGSHDIEGGEVESDNGKMYQDVSCSHCHKKWADEYTLTDIIEEEDTDNE